MVRCRHGCVMWRLLDCDLGEAGLQGGTEKVERAFVKCFCVGLSRQDYGMWYYVLDRDPGEKELQGAKEEVR